MTKKVAVCPTVTAWLTGWVVIRGTLTFDPLGVRAVDAGVAFSDEPGTKSSAVMSTTFEILVSILKVVSRFPDSACVCSIDFGPEYKWGNP